MSVSANYRRVVTGIGEDGRSCVMIDGPLPPLENSGEFVWRTPAIPADNSVQADCDNVPFDFELMHGGGSIFHVLDYPPGLDTFWHATDTIDYIVVLRGEVVLACEAGEAVCGPGTLIVDRGVNHKWRNDGPEVATIAVVNLPAHPIGKGRTV